jgi:hypothetical protein
MRRYQNDEYLTLQATALSAALSDVFIESSGKGLAKYIREALIAFEGSAAAGNILKKVDKDGTVYYERTTGKSRTRTTEPPPQYTAVAEALAPLERMGIALDPEGARCRDRVQLPPGT